MVAATLERWWFPRAWDETGLLASRLYFGDARAFLGYATAILNHETFDNGVPFHPPGWPMALALLLWLLGWSPNEPPDALTVKHITAVISGASVGAASYLAFRVAGRPAMVVTSFLGAFHFGHLVQAAAPNSEPLYGLLMITVLLQGLRFHPTAQSPRGGGPGSSRLSSAREAVVWGVLAGLTTLVRAEFALCALVLPFVYFSRSVARVNRTLALAALAFAITLTPTTVANWKTIGEFNRTRAERMPGPLPRFAPVTSYGAFNFANANHSAATGGFNFDLPSLMPETDAADPAAAEAIELAEAGVLDLSRPAVYRAYVDGYQMGMSWLLAHPVQAANLVVAKLAITLSLFDYGYLLDNVPAGLRGLRRPVDQIDLRFSFLTGLQFTLAIVGITLAWRQRSSLSLLVPVATMLVSTGAFFGYVRLGAAYLPVIWVLQSMAVTQLAARIYSPRTARPRALVAAALVGVLILLYEAASSTERRVLLMDGFVDEAGDLVEDQPVRIERVR